MRDIKLTILLPTYNEEEAIGKLIEDIQKAMASYQEPFEILVVDDHSTDKSVEIARSKGVRVVERKVNGGSGTSRRTGILEARGEIIVMMDADGSYSASDILKLIEPLKHYDQVNGARQSEKGTHKLLRIPAKWIIKTMASFLARTKIPDLNTGMKAFKRDTMKKYLWVIPDGFSCVTTMTLAYLCNGLTVSWVPILYYERIGKSKFHPIKDTYLYFLTVLRLITYFKPLNFFFPIGLTLLGVGVIKTLIDVFYILGRMQLSDIVILLVGIIVIMLGLIADLIVTYAKAVSNEHN